MSRCGILRENFVAECKVWKKNSNIFKKKVLKEMVESSVCVF
jgi:hypothetical protein